MRTPTAPLLTGLALGFALASFPACPGPATCSPASCATGCCDSAGRCQQASATACGTQGATCRACGVNESCLAGVCSPGGSGAGPAGGGGAGGGGGSSGAYGAFLTSFATAYCQKAVECGALPSSALGDCSTLFRSFVSSTGVSFTSGGTTTERSVAIGASTFDSAKAQACLGAVAAIACDMTSNADLSACVGLARPSAMLGQRCFATGDCVDSTLSCNGAACARTCSAGGNLGEACKADRTCNAPFLCRSALCQPEPAVGSMCAFASDCGPRQTCTGGRCAALPAIGEACPNARCVPDAYCDASRVCRARKMTGAACSSATECEATLRCASSVCGPRLAAGSACVTSSDCVETAPCRGGRCTAPASEGQPCDPRDFGACQADLTCDDVLRTCARRTQVETGQPCSSARECVRSTDECRNKVVVNDGGVSAPGTCGAPMVGDPCTSNFDCGAQRYCDMAARQCRAAGMGTPCSSTTQCRSTDYCTSSRICATRAAAGQVCDAASTSDSCAVAGEQCLATATAGQFRCQRLPALGEACTERCAPFAVCLAGQCVAAGREGQPCIESFPVPCFRGECVLADGGIRTSSQQGGTCQPARADGQPCSQDLACQSGFCDRLGSAFSSNTGLCAAACP